MQKNNWKPGNPDLEVSCDRRDAAEQVADRNLLVRNVDALVVLPQEPGPLIDCEQAKEQGVFLATLTAAWIVRFKTSRAGDNRVSAATPSGSAKALDGKATSRGGKESPASSTPTGRRL